MGRAGPLPWARDWLNERISYPPRFRDRFV
jgi:hypothetical protein